MTRSLTLFSAALLASLAISGCLAGAKDQQQQQLAPGAQAQPSRASSLASRLLPQQTKARSARSISDMFERVKSRIFGSKKSSSGGSQQATSAVSSTSGQIAPAASTLNSATATQQRQPWDLNSFNQQFNPYTALASNGAYQWPAGSSFMNQQYASSYPQLGSGLDALTPSASQAQQQSVAVNQPSAGSSSPSSGGGGGLLSSASHLIAQYLSPSGASSGAPAAVSSSSSSSALPGGVGQQTAAMGQQQNGQSGSSLLTPQQQQAQSQYQEFASILDSMVAQTGGNSNIQRQPAGMNSQYMQSQQQQQQPQQQMANGLPAQTNQVSGVQSYPGVQTNGQPQLGDNDMSGSSNIQSYMPIAPAATQQQASQKSSMVGLAEQLAPGAQFNKLISFPFSLSNNDDQSKEGRYKLHIPFLNQHVKRSDQQQQQQQQAAAAAASHAQAASLAAQQRLQQQQMQQYLAQQMQQYASVQQQQQQQQQQQGQQQMIAQASQVAPTIVSPQQAPAASPVSSSSSVQQPSSSSSVSSSSSSSPQASSISSAASPSNPQSSLSSSSSVVSVNQRPNWSVADTQSSGASSGSKLIPIQSAAAAAVAPSELTALN